MGKVLQMPKKTKVAASSRALLRELEKGKKPAAAAWEKNLAKAKVKQSEALAARAKRDAAAAPQGAEEKKPAPPPDWFKMPKTLGACADLLYGYRAKRLALGREEKEYEAAENALKNHLIEQLPKSNASGVAGKQCRITIKTKPIPRIEDWDAFYSGIVREYQMHVKKKDGLQAGAFALLNRALNKGTVEEHWTTGEEVPGVGSFNTISVSVEKL